MVRQAARQEVPGYPRQSCGRALARTYRRGAIAVPVLAAVDLEAAGEWVAIRPLGFGASICREQGITHRLTGVRCPTTTGKIERFHKTLRAELLTGRRFDSLAQAQQVLVAWVDDYNMGFFSILEWTASLSYHGGNQMG